MLAQLNIVTLVDVIGALSSGQLEGNFYIADNSRSARSSGQGTPGLITGTTYAQVLNWHVWAIDVQSSVHIEGIHFYRNGELITDADTPCAKLKKFGAPSGDYWAGVINVSSLIEGGLYQYKIDYNLHGKIMRGETFAALDIQDSI